MIEINLLPGAQRHSRSRAADFKPGAAIAALGERLGDRYLVLGTAGLAVGIVAIAGMWLYQSRLQSVAEQRESAAAADSARFAAVLKARAKAEVTRDSLYQQLAIIKAIDDSRYVWPHILQEVNLAVPQYTWLTAITQTSTVTSGAAAVQDTSAAGRAKADSARKTHAGDRKARAAASRAHADSLMRGEANTLSFRVTGQTVDLQALTLFMKNLEASPYIRDVQLTRSDLVTANNKQVTEFQLEARSEIPPVSLLRTVPLSIAVH